MLYVTRVTTKKKICAKVGSSCVHILCVNVWINGIVAQPYEPGINRNIEIRIDGESLEPSIPDGIDVVFHEAAYGGYMPEISKYVAVNSFGTAQLLEIIREKNLGVRKIVVASSQVVYPEGAGECPNTAWSFLG